MLKYLGKTSPDDEPLPLLTVLDSNGFDDTLWCFRAVDAVDGFEKEKQLLAITFAREVEHLMPAESKKALDVFERYVNGLATQEEFAAAAAAARSAAWAAVAAADAAVDAAAAYARAVAAWAAADAAWADAARSAAARAAYARAAAARAAYARAAAATHAVAADAAAAAAAAARSTIQAKQEAQLRQLLEKSCTQL